MVSHTRTCTDNEGFTNLDDDDAASRLRQLQATLLVGKASIEDRGCQIGDSLAFHNSTLLQQHHGILQQRRRIIAVAVAPSAATAVHTACRVACRAVVSCAVVAVVDSAFWGSYVAVDIVVVMIVDDWTRYPEEVAHSQIHGLTAHLQRNRSSRRDT